MSNTYFITDGRRYVQKAGSNNIRYTTRLKATPFGLQNAMKTLKLRVPNSQHDMFYFEESETGDTITLKQVEQEKKNEEKEDLIGEVLSLEEDFTLLESILKKIPNKVKCVAYQNKLCDLLQEEDLSLSDCNHWLRNNTNLPADVAYKVCREFQTHNVKRFQIKKAQNYLRKIEEFYDKNKDFHQLIMLFNEMKYDCEYKPRTDAYGNLNMILEQSKNRRKKKATANG